MGNPGRAGERAPRGADGSAGTLIPPAIGGRSGVPDAERSQIVRPSSYWSAIDDNADPRGYRQLVGSGRDRHRRSVQAACRGRWARPGPGGRLGADGGDQGAGPVAADPQPGAEGVAGDGPAGRRAVLGVQFPGPGQQPGREYGRRRGRGFRLPGRGRCCRGAAGGQTAWIWRSSQGPASAQPIRSAGPTASTRAVPNWRWPSAPAVFRARVSRPQNRSIRRSRASWASA